MPDLVVFCGCEQCREEAENDPEIQKNYLENCTWRINNAKGLRSIRRKLKENIYCRVLNPDVKLIVEVK